MGEFFNLFIICIALIVLVFIALAVRILFKGEFADTEISRNKNMRELGIICAKDEELKLHNPDLYSDNPCSSCATTCDLKKMVDKKSP